VRVIHFGMFVKVHSELVLDDLAKRLKLVLDAQCSNSEHSKRRIFEMLRHKRTKALASASPYATVCGG
jgi:hypothetical protein